MKKTGNLVGKEVKLPVRGEDLNKSSLSFSEQAKTGLGVRHKKHMENTERTNCAAEKNALAELAEDLEEIVKDTKSDFYTTRVSKAQRIIAELAKVKVYHNPYTGDDCWPTNEDSYKAVVACGKIAVVG